MANGISIGLYTGAIYTAHTGANTSIHKPVLWLRYTVLIKKPLCHRISPFKTLHFSEIQCCHSDDLSPKMRARNAVTIRKFRRTTFWITKRFLKMRISGNLSMFVSMIRIVYRSGISMIHIVSIRAHDIEPYCSALCSTCYLGNLSSNLGAQNRCRSLNWSDASLVHIPYMAWRMWELSDTAKKISLHLPFGSLQYVRCL